MEVTFPSQENTSEGESSKSVEADMEVTFPSQENTSEGESSKSVEAGAGPSGGLVNNNATALGKQKIRKHKIKQIPDEDMDHENEFQRVDQVSQSRSRSRS